MGESVVNLSVLRTVASGKQKGFRLEEDLRDQTSHFMHEEVILMSLTYV